jgi:hypothetical protein
MELENRVTKAPAPSRRRPRGFRDHQHFNRLAGLKWNGLQNEFAMLTDCSLRPVCLHALSIEDRVRRCAARLLAVLAARSRAGTRLMNSGWPAVVPRVIGVWREGSEQAPCGDGRASFSAIAVSLPLSERIHKRIHNWVGVGHGPVMKRLNVAFAGVIVASEPIAGCSRAESRGENELGEPGGAAPARHEHALRSHQEGRLDGDCAVLGGGNHGTRSECW